MIRTVFIVLYLIVLAPVVSSIQAAKAAQTCPKAKLMLEYDIQGEQPLFSHKLSLTLMQKYKKLAFKGHGQIGQLRGFHTRDHQYQTNGDYRYIMVGNQRCVTEMVFRFTYRLQHAIHVASNYPKGSCAFNVILAHEKQHAAFELHVLRKNKQRLKSLIRNMVVQNIHQSDDRIKAATTQAVDQFWQELIPQTDALHQGIDTPENYARENAKCRKW